MDNQYIRNLKVQKRSVGKRLYAAVCLMLVASLLLTTTSFAWLTLSQAPEVTDVATTLGANGNLEIALATTDHLASLKANNMYDDDSNFEYTTGDFVHDNVLWGNLIDLTAIDYGLHVLNMRPAILNVMDGCVADAPISVAKYGVDGRLDNMNFATENIDLDIVGFSSVYDTDKANYYAGSVEMSIDDLNAGNYDKEALVQSILDNRDYGVRIAGLLDYSASVDQSQNSANIDFLVDGYCFAIDLLFRTNAPTGNLMLQTEGVQRMESELEDEYVGSGSFIEMDNEILSAAMKVVFADTLTGKVYALAQADSEGKLWITARADETGKLVPTASDDAALIKPLTQNQVSAVTAWVFVDGNQVDNSAASTKDATALKLNLQFSTDAVLNPAYTDINTNPNYPNRPEMPTIPDTPNNPSGPVEPVDVGPVSNLHFEMINGRMALVYDYPEGISESFSSVLYDVIISNSTTGKRLTRQNRTNSIMLTEYSGLTAGTYDEFHVDSELNYEVVASADFDNLELVVSERDSTTERLYVRIDPTSELSNYGYTYTIGGLTPNTLFFLYTASANIALGTSGGPTYSAVTVGMSDANGNITAELGAWDSIMNLKDNPSEQGAELTKLYFKIVECTDTYVSDDGLSASFTQNLRCNWTHYVPGGVGTNVAQSGTHGENISWQYTTDGTLRISGSGEMTELESGKYPWSGLSGIVTKVIIEDGVTTVADYAFREFIRLQSVSFGNTIVDVGAYAFYQCYDLQNFILPNGLKIIDSCAFRDCETLTSVVMPDSVTEIGTSAFSGCSDLETVTLSTQLTKIPQTAFGWCSSLKNIVIHEGVTSIGLQAFNVCTSMETITLPTTLETIVYSAFEYCPNLSDVYYNGSKTMWKQIDIHKSGNADLTSATIHYGMEDEYVVADDGNAYFVSESDSGEYTVYTLTENGTRDYELVFNGTTSDDEETLIIDKFVTYPSSGIKIPAVLSTSTNDTLSVKINGDNQPFSDYQDMSIAVSIIPVDGQKVGIDGTSVKYLFYANNSVKFTEIGLSGLDTAGVTDMSGMFLECREVKELDVSGFDTSAVTDMSLMFQACTSITSLNLSNFDTSNVTTMDRMFNGCSSITSLDLSNFDTSNVTDMSNMFTGCMSVKTLDLSAFDTSNVTTVWCMFYNCAGLESVDLSSFYTPELTTTSHMFAGCTKLKNVDISTIDTSKCDNIGYMFANCHALTSIDVSHFVTTEVTYTAGMFYGCSALTELDLSSFNTSKVTQNSFMFKDCTALQTIYVGAGWNMSNAESTYGYLENCSARFVTAN